MKGWVTQIRMSGSNFSIIIVLVLCLLEVSSLVSAFSFSTRKYSLNRALGRFSYAQSSSKSNLAVVEDDYKEQMLFDKILISGFVSKEAGYHEPDIFQKVFHGGSTPDQGSGSGKMFTPGELSTRTLTVHSDDIPFARKRLVRFTIFNQLHIDRPHKIVANILMITRCRNIASIALSNVIISPSA